MTRKERLLDIAQHPEKHMHTGREELYACCKDNGAIDSEFLVAHDAILPQFSPRPTSARLELRA